MHNRQTGPVQRLLGEPVQLVLRARSSFGNADLGDRHLRHIDERLRADFPTSTSPSSRSSWSLWIEEQAHIAEQRGRKVVGIRPYLTVT